MPIRTHHIRAEVDPTTGNIRSVDIFDIVTSVDGDGEETEKVVQGVSTRPALLAELNIECNAAARQTRKAARKAIRDAQVAAALKPA